MQENDEPRLEHLKGRGPITSEHGGRNGVNASLLHPFGDVGKMVGQRVVYIGRRVPNVEGDSEELKDRRGGEENANRSESWALERRAKRVKDCNVASPLPKGVKSPSVAIRRG